ncbi:unnamed protein product [Pipistrellus nathusii]|uniref:F-box domain-containing protein n=1 Tax=Pipistrellus nathusii TaxID=59473 RepID=A0ABN9ZEJ6_PIPNA
MTPDLMVKACTFYTGHLVKSHFSTWKDIAIPQSKEEDIIAKKMEIAIKYDNLRLQKNMFYHWYAYMKSMRELLRDFIFRLQHIFHYNKLMTMLHKWRDRAKYESKRREEDLLVRHDTQLRKWRNRIRKKRNIYLEESHSGVFHIGEIPECDISLLPKRAILQVFLNLTLKDVVNCGQVCHSWMVMTQNSTLWNHIDFSSVKNEVMDKYVTYTLQRWRLNVLRLNFRGCPLQAKTLRSVSLCKNLQELNVSDCSKLTDETMKYISECCPGILYLNLSNTSITNRTMRLLPRHFHNLQNLSLAYCRKFTDKGLRYLSLGNGCHKLIYLDLSGCTQISVQGFRNIANSCTGIRNLTINDMPTLTDNCLKALVGHCFHITSVVFIGSPHISDLAFHALSKCNLTKIRFEGNKRITDSCFKYIDKQYPNISHIYMANCKGITDSSLKSLSPLKQLTVLNLANCIRIGDVGLKQFLDGPSGTKIRELNLSNCIQLGDATIQKLSERCQNLNYLSLRNCENLTDNGFEFIINIYSLISLDLSGTNISNEGLLKLSRHKKLKELSLAECYQFTDHGIQAFCRTSKNLEHLDVSYCTQLSNEFIVTLSIYCLELTFLSIAGCTEITDSAMEVLSAKCHYLHILDISGCALLTDEVIDFLQMGCQQLRILRMQNCTLISREAAMKMSSIVQEEYSPREIPAWSSYDDENKHVTDTSSNGK